MSQNRRWTVLAWAGVLLGVAIRARLFLEGRSFWIDEAMIALNVGRRGLLGLLEPLSYDQAAPPLYLWILKLPSTLFHNSEAAFRFPSLLAGVLLLPVIWMAGRRIIGVSGAAFGVWIAACSPPLIYFSNEVKPYALDALIAILLIWLAHANLVKARPTWMLALAGAVAIPLSIPAPFVLSAILLVFAARTLSAKNRFSQLATWAGAWGLSFVVCYSFVYRGAAENPYLRDYWANSFIGLSGEKLTLSAWTFLQVLFDPLPLPTEVIRGRYLLLALAAIITGAGFRMSLSRLVLLLAPWFVALTAALGHLYPVNARLYLWGAPFMVLLTGSALASILRPLPGQRWAIPALTGALLVLGSATWTDNWSGRPAGGVGRNPREAVALIQAGGTDIPVWVAAGAGPIWAYYTTNWEAPDNERLDWLAGHLSWGGEAFRNLPAREESVEPETGASLKRITNRRWEVLGLGMGGSDPADSRSRRRPDPGWSANEWNRLVQVTDSVVWLFADHMGDAELPPLLDEILNRGGRILAYHDTGKAWAVLVSPFGETGEVLVGNTMER